MKNLKASLVPASVVVLLGFLAALAYRKVTATPRARQAVPTPSIDVASIEKQLAELNERQRVLGAAVGTLARQVPQPVGSTAAEPAGPQAPPPAPRTWATMATSLDVLLRDLPPTSLPAANARAGDVRRLMDSVKIDGVEVSTVTCGSLCRIELASQSHGATRQFVERLTRSEEAGKSTLFVHQLDSEGLMVAVYLSNPGEDFPSAEPIVR